MCNLSVYPNFLLLVFMLNLYATLKILSGIIFVQFFSLVVQNSVHLLLVCIVVALETIIVSI